MLDFLFVLPLLKQHALSGWFMPVKQYVVGGWSVLSLQLQL